MGVEGRLQNELMGYPSHNRVLFATDHSYWPTAHKVVLGL
uniref:Uncharacterized protein n=1 Tax=Anguilla anguilla TaxID=7936 RepID=A0A0E9X9B3_ANGAN